MYASAHPNREFHLHFNLEILYGCQFSCSGCSVDKTGQDNFIEGDVSRFIQLTKEFIDDGMTPGKLLIGPSDIFTASNSKEILRNPEFQQFARMFHRISFASTVLSVDTEILDILNEFFPDTEIEFRVVMETNHLWTEKYINTLVQRFQKVRDGLNVECGPTELRPFFNIPDNLTNSELAELIKNYDKLDTQPYRYFNNGIDPAMAFSRNPATTKQQKLNNVLMLRDIFNLNSSKTNPFELQNLNHFEGQLLTYRNGEFFWGPKVYDEFINFNDMFNMNIKEWTREEFKQKDQEMLINQYANITDKPCVTCHYAPVCIDRKVLFLMDYFDTTECIIPIKAYDDANTQNTARDNSITWVF